MSKRKGHVRREEPLDKPAFALGEEPGLKEGETARAREARMELADRLDERAFAQLKKLKSQMEPAEPKGAQAKSRSQAKPQRRNEDAADEPSFAELLNPKDDPEASFEDLLNHSKLDWRTFK